MEAFYHHDFTYDVNQLLLASTERDVSVALRSWVPPQDIYRDNGQGGAISTQMALTDANTFSFRDTGLVTGQV